MSNYVYKYIHTCIYVYIYIYMYTHRWSVNPTFHSLDQGFLHILQVNARGVRGDDQTPPGAKLGKIRRVESGNTS